MQQFHGSKWPGDHPTDRTGKKKWLTVGVEKDEEQDAIFALRSDLGYDPWFPIPSGGRRAGVASNGGNEMLGEPEESPTGGERREGGKKIWESEWRGLLS